METNDMLSKFLKKSKELVIDYSIKYNSQAGLDPNAKDLTTDDVFVVWKSKVLQNSKLLLASNLVDGLYFETTYNGDKKEMYFDAYEKISNKVVKL